MDLGGQQHHQEAQITDCHDCPHSEWLLSFWIRLHHSQFTVRYLYDRCLSTPFQLAAGATDDVTALIWKRGWAGGKVGFQKTRKWWIMNVNHGWLAGFPTFVSCWIWGRLDAEEITVDMTSHTGHTALLSDSCYIAVCVWSRAYCIWVASLCTLILATWLWCCQEQAAAKVAGSPLKTAVTIIVPANIVIAVDQWGKWLEGTNATNIFNSLV